MQNKIKQLALDTLNVPQDPQNYTSEDLFNATLVFTHFFTDLSYQHMREKKITQEHAELLAEEFGKNVRQTILLATGIDMHLEAKKY